MMGVDIPVSSEDCTPGGGLCLRQMEKHLQLKFNVTKLQDAPASVVRSQCTGLCRHFDSSKRLKFRDQAVQFSAALHAKFSWSQTERDQLMKSFADGAADAAMAHSSAPAAWPPVRHIQRCRQEEATRLAQEACQKQLEEKKAAAQRAWDEAREGHDKADITEAEAVQMGSFASEQMMEVWRTNFKRFFMFLRASSLYFFVAIDGLMVSIFSYFSYFFIFFPLILLV